MFNTLYISFAVIGKNKIEGLCGYKIQDML